MVMADSIMTDAILTDVRPVFKPIFRVVLNIDITASMSSGERDGPPILLCVSMCIFILSIRLSNTVGPQT